MKSSEILREAARLVENGQEEYGCLAIKEIVLNNTPMKEWVDHSYWAEYWLQNIRPIDLATCGGYWHYKVKGPRIIGLCLAAAIAESEGD